MAKVGIIHTSFVSVEHLKKLFGEILPDVELINIVDDNLLAEVVRVGHVNESILLRYIRYAGILQELGVDLIFNQCSSMGKAVDIARQAVQVPILKVDEPMARRAAQSGNRIGVVATVACTVSPSVGLVESFAEELGKKVQVTPYVVHGALEILMRDKNREKHNSLVLEEIRKAAGENEVVVLAQGSMVVLEPFLSDIGVPVLTSPRLGVEEVARTILKL